MNDFHLFFFSPQEKSIKRPQNEGETKNADIFTLSRISALFWETIDGLVNLITHFRFSFPMSQTTSPVQKSDITAQSSSATSPAQKGDAADLIAEYSNAWNERIKDFILPENSFNEESFSEHLLNHTNIFKKNDVLKDSHFGYIEKYDLTPADEPQIYMRADLHGDLKSLLENLRTLQEQGLLDTNFKCNQGVHLVFLGDYCDRGKYGTQVLEILMRLREENPDQVHLIRGNHEYAGSNAFYADSDPNMKAFLMPKTDGKDDLKKKETRMELIENFYETMPLTTYFSVDQGGEREYIQCTHGLFEPSMDPSFLLDEDISGSHLPVPKERKLSERVTEIAKDKSHPLFAAGKQVCKIVENFKKLENEYTAYNWGDVTHFTEARIDSLLSRRCSLPVQDIRYYLDLSSQKHRVSMIFRGHQHRFAHLIFEDKVVVTTLPIGMDCGNYSKEYKNQDDRAYIITRDLENKAWKKSAILREINGNRSKEISGEFPLQSPEI